MNRKEFMEELENLLGNIQDSEREEALQYYNDYFDEAGVENEGEVIRELGTPAKVAAIIRTSLQENENVSGEFTERGYSDPRFTINYEVIDNFDSENKEENSHRTYTRERKAGKEASGGKIALIVILCLLAIPVGLPILGSLFGLAMGIIGVSIALFVTIIALAVSLCVGGVVVFGVGIVALFTTPLTGIFSCGVGLMLVGIGILFVLLSAQICCRFIPWLVRSFVNLCRVPLRRRGTI
ncbi:DUF1700 domain-containing protein [Candidatus Galacturonibacter soehngenii]|uniref:DUF1700 domain-containing protein n=1 Tax=Candidatus Galacturonatibacter soehngenii TaxID=2307010 RepID=A0A7V7QP28_9FIRM|nr:DUF1700 domain-containing protein [Candidatus Galacturonibacter soehngenii]KAB1440458.1 DUF1700 domain-containing protein [Candidatus Galacturonibacter soehngenii]